MRFLFYIAVVAIIITLAYARDEFFEEMLHRSPFFNPHAIPDGMNTHDAVAMFQAYERAGKVDATGGRWNPHTAHKLPRPTADKSKEPHLRNPNPKHLPTSWDWRERAPLHSQVMSQRTPTWCGACFLYATVSALTNRYIIHYPEVFPNTILSVQDVLNCAQSMGFPDIGCDGSQYELAMAYIQKYGIVDTTCQPYTGTHRTHTVLHRDCIDYQCRTCTSDGTCGINYNAKRWKIASWGQLRGEAEMMAELVERGPITCYIYTYVDSYVNWKGGIISDPTRFAPGNITHVVAIEGYGEEAGVPYWIARNWSGTQTYENGWFRVYRGNNTMNVEWNCGYAIPDPKL